MKRKTLFILLIMMMFPIIVRAEDNTCSYKDKAELNKLSYNVSADYTYNTENKVTTFKISVYNIVEDLYVVVTNDYDRSDQLTIFPDDTRGGTYTFEVKDVDNIITYSFAVRSSRQGCIENIRTFTIVKPKKNPYHELDMCKYSGMEEFYYCREWIQSTFTVSKEEIERKIAEQLDVIKTTVKTRCIECEKEEQIEEEKRAFNDKKSFAIKILVVLIIINIVVTILLFNRARSYEI